MFVAQCTHAMLHRVLVARPPLVFPPAYLVEPLAYNPHRCNPNVVITSILLRSKPPLGLQLLLLLGELLLESTVRFHSVELLHRRGGPCAVSDMPKASSMANAERGFTTSLMLRICCNGENMCEYTRAYKRTDTVSRCAHKSSMRLC